MASLAKKTSNFVVWILLGLLFVALAGVGITSFSGGSSQVAEVGDANVTAGAYQRALRNEINRRISQSGRLVRLSELQAERVDEQIRAQLITLAALRNEAQNMGLAISDETMVDQLFAIPAFQGQDGFSRALYEASLNDQRITPAEFEDQIRGDLSRGLLEIAVSGGISAPEALSQALVAREVETRSITVAQITEAAVADTLAEPSDGELQSFYDDNPELFTRPEVREISYAWLTPDMLIDEVEVDEAELRALYDSRIDDFVRPERRLLERLPFPSQEEAEAAAAALEAGEASFEDLVEARRLRLEDIDLGDVAASDLPEAAAEVIFAAEAPGIVGPVESQFGPALFRINAALNATEVSFEDAREDLRQELALEAARVQITQEQEPIDDLLASGAELEDLESDTPMQFGQLRYGSEADEAETILGYDAFREAADTAQESDFPELIELSDGGLAALRLDGITPPALPDFAEITDEVETAWRAASLDDALLAEAQTLLTAIATEGRSLDAAGQADGVEILSFEDQRRQGFLPGLPITTLATVFDLDNVGDLAVVPSQGQALVVRLDAITPGNLNSPDVAALVEIIGQQAGQSLATDLFLALALAMEGDVGIRINQAVINQVHSQFR